MRDPSSAKNSPANGVPLASWPKSISMDRYATSFGSVLAGTYMRRLIILAALLCLAAQTHAQQSEYGDMTNAHVKAIQMTALAMLAGRHGNCPSFHVIESALSEEWHDANISTDAPKFKNAMNLSSLGPLEQMRKDPVEFCRGAWELLGSSGLYRSQLLEAN